MSVESVARSTSITTVSRPTCGHTEVSTTSRGQRSGARPPHSLPVSPPGPLVGDLKSPQSPSLLPLSTEEERRGLLYLGEHTGVGDSRTCHQAPATSVPCLFCIGLLPPRMPQCCSVSLAPAGKMLMCHLVCSRDSPRGRRARWLSPF